MASELIITIKARNEAERAFKQLQGDLDKLDKQTGVLGKGFSALQTGMGAALNVVGVGAAAATAAVTGVAVAGVKSFAEFERGMSEVFTLMPGISDRAMGDMTQQVKDFAVEFGTLPNEVVPALYQSLSAGVPADNVFAFMETAQKAAIGGVADLETAVDGISSTVNAYGADILSATEASDQMFTAVRLGKTTFGELSNSLFNVIPVASSLGVKFGDVGAGIAAITAQGVPTSVATTQMRQAFVELSKDGGETADLFERLAGESFRDFIASGKDTQQALQLLERYAQDTGVGINDLFGSVEAGNAALALTGKGTEAFTNALNEMETSAGATQAAFDQMMQGLQPIFDRLKAMWQVALLDIGNAIGPALEPVVSWLERILPAAIDIAVSFFEKIGTAAGTFFTALEDGESPLSAFRLALASLLTPEQVQWLSDLEENIRGVISAIDTATQPMQDFITKWVELKDVMIALGIVAGVTLVSALGGIAGALAAPLLALGALTLAVAAVRTAWEADFLGIQTIVTSLISYFDDLIKSGDTLNDMLTKVPAPIANIADALGDAYTAWKRYGSVAEAAIAFFDNFADHFEVVRTVNKVRDALNRARRAVDTFLTALSDGKTPIAAFREALGSILSFEQAMFLSMMEMGIRGVITAITDAVTPIANFVTEWVKWQDVLIAIGLYAIPGLVGALGTLLAPIAALAVALAGPLVTLALLTAAVAALRIAWETNFADIQGLVDELKPKLAELYDATVQAWQDGDWQPVRDRLNELTQIVGDWAANDLRKALRKNEWWREVEEILYVMGWNVRLRLYQIEKFFTDSWEAIKIAAIDRWEDIKNAPGQAMDELKAALQQSWSDLTTSLENEWGTMRLAAETMWMNLKNTALLAWGWIKDNIVQPIQDAYAALNQWWADIRADAVEQWALLSSAALTAWGWVKDNIILPVQGAYDALAQWWNDIRADAVEQWALLSSAALTAWGWVRDNIILPVQGAYTALSVWWNDIRADAVEQWAILSGTALTVWGWIRDNIITPISEAKETAGQLWRDIQLTASRIWATMFLSAQQWWNAVKAKILEAIGNARDLLVPIWNAIQTTAVAVWGAIEQAMLVLVTAKNAVVTAFNNFKSFVAGLTFSNPFGPLLTFIQSVINKADSARRALSSLAGAQASALSSPNVNPLLATPGTPLTSGNIYSGGRAAGTMFYPGGLTNLNERGPELILMPGRNRQAVLPRGTQILSAEQTAALAGGPGQITINLYPTISNNIDWEAAARRLGFILQRQNRLG